MKTKLLFSKALPALALAVFLVGCSTSIHLSKKRYSDGYYVNIVNKEAPVQKNSLSSTTKHNELLLAAKKIELAPANESNVNAAKSENHALKNISTPAVAQQSNNKEIKASRSSKKEELKPAKKANAFFKKDDAELSDKAILLYIIAVLLPWLAVGLVTDWDLLPTIVTLLLWLTVVLWIVAVIYALIKVHRSLK